MRFLMIVCSILMAQTSQAGWLWGSDERDRDVCVNWNGEKEPCYGPYKRSDHYYGLQMYSFIDDKEKSPTGSYGYGATYLASSGQSHVRFIYGGSLWYAATQTWIADEDYRANILAADLIFGLQIKPSLRSVFRPVLEISAIGGIKSMNMANPPANVDEQTLGFSYGGKGGVGFEIGFSKFTAFKTMLEYQAVRVSELAGQKDFSLNGLGLTVGLSFLY